MAKKGNNNLMLPAIVGIVGAIALAVAILIVPVLVNRTVQERFATVTLAPPAAAEPAPAPAPPAENVEAKPAEAKPAEEKPAEAKPDEEKPAEAKPAEAKPAEEKPAEAKPAEAKPAEAPVAPPRPPGGGHPSWRIAVSLDGYKIDAKGERAVSEIAAYLKAKDRTRAKMTGMNSPKYSSKRAKVAARRIRDKVADAGVSRKRMWTEAVQTEEASGFEVVVTVVGGAR